MSRTITIKPGKNLSLYAQEYNTTVDELMRLNPLIKHRDKILAGANLNVPDLADTLEKGGGTDLPGQKLLPEGQLDRLSMFRDLLKTVTSRAAREAKATGMKALPPGMLKPSEVSGGTFASILGLVSQEKTRGIADIYKSTIDMLDEQQNKANSQLTMLINTGAIANLDDATLKKLAESAHIPLDYLKEVRSVKKPTGRDWVNFSDQEKRRLEQAGINWMTPEGYREALTFLYGEDGDTPEANMKRELMAQRGEDHYVSPEIYKLGKDKWHEKGLSRREYDKHFEMFVNPGNPEDYGIEGV